jgi:ubiquinol-cytochrome c reductase iron-sulfur subunit
MTVDRERATPELTAEQRGAERAAAVAFVVAILAGIGLFVVYFAGGQTQLEGVLFALALGGFGVGIVLWGNKLLGAPDAVEERHELGSGEAGLDAFEHAAADEVGPVLGRRSVLVKLLVGASGALGLALLLPVLSLGPAPGRTLKETAWKRGSKVIDETGKLITLDSIPENGFITVFPEGHAGSADSQALLIRVPEGLLRLPPEKLAGVPEGTHVCYSKICTHAGCPVGLYRAETHSLLCPCHQSQFDLLQDATPVFGPAARPLPKLAITVDDEGYFVAKHDFVEPIGPSFWERP